VGLSHHITEKECYVHPSTKELPSFTIEIHHDQPDKVGFTRMQPARSSMWSIYPLGEQQGWNYSRFSELFTEEEAEKVVRPALRRKGFVITPMIDLPKQLRRYIILGVAPVEWHWQPSSALLVRRITVWVKGTFPEQVWSVQ
jgi:hypothetical protein